MQECQKCRRILCLHQTTINTKKTTKKIQYSWVVCIEKALQKTKHLRTTSDKREEIKIFQRRGNYLK